MGAVGAAEQEWTVPPQPAPIVFEVDGEVELDRSSQVPFTAGTRDLIIERAVSDGTVVRAGDPILVFDSRLVAAAAEDRAADLVIAERTLELDRLNLEQQLEDLAAQKDSAEDDLRICRAALAGLTPNDAAAAELARAEQRLAELHAAQAARQAESQRVLSVDGQIPQRDYARAAEAAEVAGLEVELSKLRAQRAAAGDPLHRERLELQERQLVARLGVAPDGSPDTTSGLNGQLAALRAQQERQRVADVIERDRVKRDYHMALRDAYDHTPLTSIELIGTDRTTKVCFLPAGVPPPEGAIADRGQAYDDARGFGWIGTPPPVTLRDGLAVGDAAGKPDAGVALAQGRATWRAHLPDGHYQVVMRFGDGVDWYGAVAHLATAATSASEGTPPPACFVADRLPSGKTLEAKAAIDVSGGWLELRLGDDLVRAIRAPSDGIALPKIGLLAGAHPDWREDQIAFFVDRGHVVVHARVPIPLVPLLAVGGAKAEAAASGATAAARARLAATTMRIRGPDGVEVVGTVSAIVKQPILPWRRPKEWAPNASESLDASANQVDLVVASADALRLPLGAAVRCRAEIALAAPLVALPAHLVEMADDRAWIQPRPAREPVAITAFRAGDWFIAIAGVQPGDRLAPPHVRPEAAGASTQWVGEVVAGKRTPVGLPMSWGRIRELTPEGSQVERGQVIFSLYNPSLESRKDQIEADRKRANQAFLLAAEQRRASAVAAANQHRELSLAERDARLALAVAATPAVDAEDSARVSLSKAELAASLADRELAGAEALKQYDRGQWQEARAGAERAHIDEDKARLDRASARRSGDWLAVATAEDAWRDALDALGLREGEARVDHLDDQVAAAKARLQLDQANNGWWWQGDFNRVKDVRAAASGKLFYLNAWNDRSNAMSKLEKDSEVWGGMNFAEILDMGHLSFRAELPEARFRAIAVGQAVELRFPGLDERRLPGRITALGRAFHLGKDSGAAGQPVANERLLTVTVDFEPPADLQGLLVPGSAGVLVLP
jgi:multidrug efflux pump subunit AcrA (membrane-fusion protein)